MLKAAVTVYKAGAGIVFFFSTLFLAFQIFRPTVGGADIWRGDPEGPPPGKGLVFAIKVFILLSFAAWALCAAAVWPLFLLLAIGAYIYDHFTQRRQDGENNDYRR